MIADEQRAEVLAVLNSDAYRDLAIPQAWARELDEGRYWCSESSMYRIAGQSRQRRAQATHPALELVAYGPSEVWSWDITALKGPRKGEWHELYVVLDIFSRYVPVWLAAHAEDAVVAKDFLVGAVSRNLVNPHTIHADRGGSMTSKPVSEMMIDLGILRRISAKSFATCCGTSRGSGTSRSPPLRSSISPSFLRGRVWIRCGCAVDGNFGPEVALCGTSAHRNSPSPDLTDSDIRSYSRLCRRPGRGGL